MQELVEFNPGYSSPLGCWSCKSHSADLGACLFTSYDGLVYFHCGKCSKKCRVIGCNECLPNQSHHCRWCNRDDVTHQEKDCPLLKRITLTLKQSEIHLKAQNQSEEQRHALILEEKAKLIKDKFLIDQMKTILESIKIQHLEILLLSNNQHESQENMKQEVTKQINEYKNQPNSLMWVINDKVKHFPLLITY